MKRLLIGAVVVALLVTRELGAEPGVTVWVQGADGGNVISLGVSETASIQLWASIGNSHDIVTSMDIFLDARDWAFVRGAEHFRVTDFVDHTIYDDPGTDSVPSDTQRVHRGATFTNGTTGLPGSIDDYEYFSEDPDIPSISTGDDGIDWTSYPRSILLDEIIIRGVSETTQSDVVNFSTIELAPTGFYMDHQFGWGWFGPVQLNSVAQGTGLPGNFLFVNVTPEPATLGLLALGGLSAFRRRR